MTAGALGIDDGVETKIDTHHDTLRRARSNVARSSPCSASIIAIAKLPGPCARCAGDFAGDAERGERRDGVASQGSRSTASAAQTSAAPAQPIAVTSPINGSPLAMAMPRRPSVTVSMSPVSATMCRMRLGKARRRLAIRLSAGEGRKLRVIEAHH